MAQITLMETNDIRIGLMFRLSSQSTQVWNAGEACTTPPKPMIMEVTIKAFSPLVIPPPSESRICSRPRYSTSATTMARVMPSTTAKFEAATNCMNTKIETISTMIGVKASRGLGRFFMASASFRSTILSLGPATKCSPLAAHRLATQV